MMVVERIMFALTWWLWPQCVVGELYSVSPEGAMQPDTKVCYSAVGLIWDNLPCSSSLSICQPLSMVPCAGCCYGVWSSACDGPLDVCPSEVFLCSGLLGPAGGNCDSTALNYFEYMYNSYRLYAFPDCYAYIPPSSGCKSFISGPMPIASKPEHPLNPLLSPSPRRLDCARVSDFEYAFFSNLVYGGVALSSLDGVFPGWTEVNCSACTAFSVGFYGQLFNKSGTYVFAVRGTDLSLTGNIGADIDLVLNNDVTGYLNNYVTQAIDYLSTAFSDTSPTCLTFTGHSLGAALAEVLAGKYQSSSIGFENPGAASYMRKQNIPTGNVTAYQASPNLIDTLDTSAINTIYRVFPPYTYPSIINQALNAILAEVIKGVLPIGQLLGNTLKSNLIPEYIEYTLQQHDMSNILEQFNPVTGQPYVFSNQTKAWSFFSTQEGFSGFFLRYDLNSYYWLNKNTALAGSLLSRLEGSLNTAYNFVITGSDNHDDLLWGAGYDDVLDGKSGNDQYWAFSGMNTIIDENGNDVYHFFTTNMQGITTINDADGLGIITLDNYGNCNIQARGIILANIVGTDNVVSAFYPNDPNTGCQTDSTFSSQAFGILNNYHNNDIFFLQLSGPHLMITLNSIAINPSNSATIIINNFQGGNFGISFSGTDRAISDSNTIYYVSFAAGEVLKCDFKYDTYLFGLTGSNVYMNYDNNPYNCVMVGNSGAANTFMFMPGYAKEQNVKARLSAIAGISTIQGYKTGDLIDISAFNSSGASFQQNIAVGQVTMTLSNGITILLPSVYNNISYTLDGKNNLTFVPNIISPFNTTTTSTPTVIVTSSDTITTTISATRTPSATNGNTATATPTVSSTNSGTTTTTISETFSTTNIDYSATSNNTINNKGIYIGVAVGTSIAGSIAVMSGLLYCYRKRQKNKPNTIGPQDQEGTLEVLIPDHSPLSRPFLVRQAPCSP